MKAFNNATHGGLDIFKKYVNLPVVVDKQEVVRETDQRYVIKHSETYNCLVMFIEKFDGKAWRKENNFNAIWFVKFKFGLTEDQTYEKVDYEMNLNLLQSLKDGSYSFEEKVLESEIEEEKEQKVEIDTTPSSQTIFPTLEEPEQKAVKKPSILDMIKRDHTINEVDEKT